MGTKLLGLETNQRKNLAIWMMFGGSLVFTIFAAIGLWLVAANLQYVFWLAVVAHVQLALIMTGFIGQLIKRRISVNKDGFSSEDLPNDSSNKPTE